MPVYRHTQTSPMWFLLLIFVPAFIIGGLASGNPALMIVLPIIGGCFLLLSASFRSLTIEDAGEYLRVRFGPLPLLGTRLWYKEMENPVVGRSRSIDGWGIHWAPGRGWTYNLWGYDCVEFRYRGKLMRVGSDDAPGLARFLQKRISGNWRS